MDKLLILILLLGLLFAIYWFQHKIIDMGQPKNINNNIEHYNGNSKDNEFDNHSFNLDLLNTENSNKLNSIDNDSFDDTCKQRDASLNLDSYSYRGKESLDLDDHTEEVDPSIDLNSDENEDDNDFEEEVIEEDEEDEEDAEFELNSNKSFSF